MWNGFFLFNLKNMKSNFFSVTVLLENVSLSVEVSKLVLKCRLSLLPQPVELNVLMDCQQSKTYTGLKNLFRRVEYILI